jgi:LysR family nitrogen assimilation transcriptional regulator
MNLRQLKYFLSVVDTGNMTRAAEHLNVAQTALGMQIKQLEESLGVTLLVRHSRGVEPTKAGSLLRERALEILNWSNRPATMWRAARLAIRRPSVLASHLP